MCQVAVYLDEEKIMDSVMLVEPIPEGIRLVKLFEPPLVVTAVIRNTGSVAGDEIVQLYVRDLVGEVTRPVKELKGFQRLALQPGESQMVRFTVPAQALGFHGLDMQYKVESGAFQVWVGPSSAEGLVGDFVIV